MLSRIGISDEQAEELSELYFIEDRGSLAERMGVPSSILKHWLVNPKVLSLIKKKAEEMSRKYSREDHIRNLEKIRELALDEEKLNLKVALAAEVSIGRAAGLYESFTDVEDNTGSGKPVESLSTDEIKRRLSNLIPHQPNAPARVANTEFFNDDTD
jgi:hypothetical protein